jgi:hypothetical protein
VIALLIKDSKQGSSGQHKIAFALQDHLSPTDETKDGEADKMHERILHIRYNVGYAAKQPRSNVTGNSERVARAKLE